MVVYKNLLMNSVFNQKSFIIPTLLFLITLLIYIFMAGRFNFKFPTHSANYFSHLSYSFLNGRLDLINPSWNNDLSTFNGKLYAYWGPTPILLILPFIKIFGLNFSDALYTAIISSIGPLIFYFILQELDKLEIARISNFKKFILSLFLGFGTVYFILSINGGVWFTSQAVSTLYILISILFILKFKRFNKLRFLILAIIFLNLGIWGRTTFIFYLIFFLAIIISVKNFRISIFYFSLICLLFFLLFITYNYLRFGAILETGFLLQNWSPIFVENKQKYGIVNLSFFPTNFHYMFLNFPYLKPIFPYLQLDYWGNSIFSTSPLFILLILIFKKQYWQKSFLLFNGSILSSIIATIFFLLIYFNTGYLQFGSRYLMDAIPLMLILLAQMIKAVHIRLILMLCLLSIAINTAGVLWFLNLL